jgi:hypothetical protein
MPANPQDLENVPELEPLPEFKPESESELVVTPLDKPLKADEPVIKVKAPKILVEKRKIKECAELAKKIEEELKKPIEQQDYTDISKALKDIVKNPKAGKAQFYAGYHLDQVERFELALTADNLLKKQEAALAEAREQINRRRSEKVENVPDPGRFIVSGESRSSNIYTSQTDQKRFLVVNDVGKILCYAIPDENAGDINIESLLGHKVGLLGKVVSDPHNPVSLVKFTDIVELKAASAEE